MTWHTKTLTELSNAVAAGETTSRQLTEHFIARVEAFDGELNTFVTRTFDSALAAADAADARRVAGESLGPLDGLPFAHKDIFCTKGVKTTCGSKMLDNFISPYDATVVEKLQAAGMVCLGKTNMDEFAMGSSNETSYYGDVKNPWDTSKVPGGSSGGSASAVGARLVPTTTGTDTGGSIRQPAAFCGITGIKPTYGRVSRYGMIAFASSLDQAGVFATTAEDAALMLQAMSGFDERDSTSIERPVDDLVRGLGDSLKGKTIGLPKQFFDDGLDVPVRNAVNKAIKVFKALGADVKGIDLPNIGLSVPVYYVVAPAEASANLSRFDGVRYGHRCDNPEDLTDLYKRTRAEGFGDEVKRRIMMGTYALSSGYYDAYYIKAQKIRRLIRDDFLKAFEEVDLIAGPTTPGLPFGLGEQTEDPVTMYLNDIFTIGVNLAGLPGMSIPAGMEAGLPIGLQLIGKHFGEAELLNAAHQYQQKTDWHKAMPAAYQ